MRLLKSHNYNRNKQKGKVVIPILETKVSFSQTCYIKKGNLDKHVGKKGKKCTFLFLKLFHFLLFCSAFILPKLFIKGNKSYFRIQLSGFDFSWVTHVMLEMQLVVCIQLKNNWLPFKVFVICAGPSSDSGDDCMEGFAQQLLLSHIMLIYR